ncbi:CU044_2847 family protein [Streptomyces sp. NBC_01304]|uniref:CU044_2847 family protein n=1 Tax=Streptomyces sp. NBC_01304 TaxID=2903818 RepID=UPI002E15668E|nr:hypothetical protein OG430_00285 [Streptomyces sp. NBC_01304]
MGEYVEFTFGDDQAVLLEVMPSPLRKPGEEEPGMELLESYGRGGDVVRRAARGALLGALSPLVPVLESVRQTTDRLADPPHEVTVEVGVRITDDLKLGIVGVRGEAGLIVRATWRAPRDEQSPDD